MLDACVRFFDGDYSADGAWPPSAVGVPRDLGFYTELAASGGGPVLELGGGTGRLTLPIARRGTAVTAVELDPGMLAQLRSKLALEDAAVRARVDLVEADAVTLDLGDRRFARVLMPFNFLMLLTERAAQQDALRAAAAHLAPDGLLALDVMNPAAMTSTTGTSLSPSVQRRDPRSGNTYIKFTATSAVGADGCQHVHGRYDEILPDGHVASHPFAYSWRMVPLEDLTGMLAPLGMAPRAVFGDFEATPWARTSRRIVLLALGHDGG